MASKGGMDQVGAPAPKKRRSGVPTGNAGEYFVMGELLRRGYDAQLADRNTQGYDMLVGLPKDEALRKVQVKTVRTTPWYVRKPDFDGEMLSRITIYVLIGNEKRVPPVRYFIARNQSVAGDVRQPPKWANNAFIDLKALAAFEDNWALLLE